ncbi:MAG: ribonuclease III domain-containing protein, partial [Clostridia bacterium]
MLNDMNVAELQKTIGYTFEDKALLCRAFVHSSYANLKKQKSYERLEFLGDSLIGFVVADRLVADFPTKQEGDLTRMRQRLVEGKNLASLSRKLGFESCVSVIKNVAVSDDILEDVFEALVAAIYLDGGFEKAKTFVLNNFESQLDNMDEKVEKDFKSMVNE